MKIWLDDIRTPPDDTWKWARSAFEFKALFNSHAHEILEISFDHDIASFDILGNEITGYHCLCMVEKFWRYVSDFELPKMQVHSANPVGRAKMQKVIDALERG